MTTTKNNLVKRIFTKQFPSLFKEFDNVFDFDDIFTYPRYLDRSGGSLLTKWTNKKPLMNVSETENDYTVELSVPGLTKENVKIELNDDILTVKGQKNEKESEQQDNYSYSEFSYSGFERSFTLPENVNTEEISAKHENGILKLTIPKLEIKKVMSSKEIKVS